MPTRYLSAGQRSRFGRFNSDPSPDELARFFHLDADDHQFIRNFRGEHTRLGYAALRCSVRFIGTFPEGQEDIPLVVLSYLRAQLNLQVRDRPTTLARALMQLGRLIKTLHVLNYIDDAGFRRRILIQLNRQEFRHKLARKIYHGERGEVRNALKQGQEEQLGALGLALNAVIHWNAIYMQEALTSLNARGISAYPGDIARLSPILWRHINVLGRYEIALPEIVKQGGLRPLRNPNYEWDF